MGESGEMSSIPVSRMGWWLIPGTDLESAPKAIVGIPRCDIGPR